MSHGPADASPHEIGSEDRRENPAREQKAGEGTRTLDIQLGKLALYQLSYARETPGL